MSSQFISSRILGFIYVFVCILFNANSIAAEVTAQSTVYKRYNLSGEVTGIIYSSPDGTRPLSATRNIYNLQGLIEKSETGTLTSLQNEFVEPSSWSGFTPHIIKTYTYSNGGMKLTEATKSADNVTRTLIQFSYNTRLQLECVAKRMNPAVYSSLPANACSLGSEGEFGPDRITKFTYQNKKLIEERRGLGTPLEQAYATYTYRNEMSKPDSVTDANGNYTKMLYDKAHRLTYIYFPDKIQAGTHNADDYERYEYDANGNRTLTRKRDGQEIKFEYDQLNRVKRKDIPSSENEDIYYSYNLQDLQLYARFGSHSGLGIDVSYTGFGEIKNEKTNLNSSAYTVGYLYDANSNRTRITYPDGKYFVYTYDGSDRLVDILENGVATLTHITYTNHGLTESLTTAGNVVTTLGYDSISRTNKVEHEIDGNTHDLKLDFSYSPSGQIMEQGTNNDFYQHKEVESLTYDYKTNGINQYENIGGRTITYDARGNLSSDGNTVYTYDIENRLTKFSTGGISSNTLYYDPLGKLYRIAPASGQSTYFLYSGDSLIAEYQEGVMTKRYVFGADVDKPLISYTGSSVAASNRQFLHSNHQGSIIAATNSGGAVAYVNTYDAYGVPGVNNQGRFAYTGQTFLPDLGMYYYKARIYAPLLGRFLQTDPVGYEDQMNLYTYVGNDPINLTDPTGMFGIGDFVILAVTVMVIYMVVDATEKGQTMNMNERQDKIEAAINGEEYTPPEGPSGTDVIKLGVQIVETGTSVPGGTAEAAVQSAADLVESSPDEEDKAETTARDDEIIKMN